MTHPKSHAFLDESGEASLNIESTGASTHFIIAAILVKNELLDEARSGAEKIRAKHFGKSEMKSSGVGYDDARRIRILEECSKLPISYFVFIADKRQIRKDSGLIYKRPFIKFLSGKIYSRLFRTFQNIDLTADQHGNPEFMQGVEKYVIENHIPELFPDGFSSFSFGESKAEPFIQVADMVAGSIAKIYDEHRKSQAPLAILAALKPQLPNQEIDRPDIRNR